VENGWYDSISLSDYLGVVWRRKWIVLFVMVLVAATAALYAHHEKKLYSASATVLSPSQNSPANKNGTAATWASDNIGYVTAPAFARLVIGQIPALHGANPYTLAGQVSALATATGNGLTITAIDSNPSLAVHIANEYASQLGGYIDSVQLNGPLGLEAQQTSLGKAVAADQDGVIKAAAGQTTSGTSTPAMVAAQQKLQNDENALKAVTQQISALQRDVAVTSATATSATQTQPKTVQDIAIGAAVGLVVGILLAFLQDLLDTRVRNTEEVQRRLRLPLLAKVPSPPKGSGPVVMLDEPTPRHRASAEAYRILKLNLLSALRERGVRTILMTAGGDNEGTSTTAANLAVVLARSGLHVVLVDANLRAPVQHQLFQLGEGDGLADVVTGKARLADVLKVVDVAHHTDSQSAVNGGGVEGLLEVLPAGTIPGDSADLLDNRVATALLGTLRDRADVVLVDSPAALPTTDAMVLATKVDAIIAIARTRLALRPEIVALRRALASVPALAIGFVFTGTSPKERIDYGGGYSVPARAPASPRLEEELTGAREATLR
jgi:Mrp family chromosome partitioning ATPase/ElaB/YqjD/DUF883 family membrane-anchored ribosome-binding protein